MPTDESWVLKKNQQNRKPCQGERGCVLRRWVFISSIKNFSCKYLRRITLVLVRNMISGMTSYHDCVERKLPFMDTITTRISFPAKFVLLMVSLLLCTIGAMWERLLRTGSQ